MYSQPIIRAVAQFCAVGFFGCWFVLSGCSESPNDGAGIEGGGRYEGYDIKPLKAYDMKVRVLARKDYKRGREADLSPTDLALGWGPMANPDISQQISVSQRNRWYFWNTPKYPIPRREIEINSANVHIIPADNWVATKLKRVKAGDLLKIRGQLVEVSAPDGWRWRSSLSFTDTGNHSCELLLAEDLVTLSAS